MADSWIIEVTLLLLRNGSGGLGAVHPDACPVLSRIRCDEDLFSGRRWIRRATGTKARPTHEAVLRNHHAGNGTERSQ